MTDSPRMDSRRLTQLVKRTFRCEKVPRGEKPVFEFLLDEHERLVGIAYEGERDHHSRKTVDHWVVAWIAVDLGVRGLSR